MATIGGCTEEQYASVLSALHRDAAAAAALCKVFSTSDRTEEVAFGLNTVFMLFSGALVFIMHGGFAMLEAGAIRSKNAMNILLQTVLDGAASAVMWYLVGFGFAFGIGDRPNGFIGDALFALSRLTSHESGVGTITGDWTNWFFQWAFCATAATIPAGAVAERFNFNAYLGYSLFLGGFVYPVVVHWVWCRTGWLGYGADSPLLGAGMIDFAGSGVVHMVGGIAGLLGAWLVGPRLGRFDANGQPVPMPGHSAILVVLGTVLLWFGWYGFNPGSALVADTAASAAVAGRAAVTTTLSGAAGGLTCLALGVARNKSWDLTSLCNGMLVGFVAITAGCAVVEPWAALLSGMVGAALFEGACSALLAARVDDVVGAGPMHGLGGAWGVLFVGLLAKEEYVRQAFTRDVYPYGLFYGGGGKLLASQVIGVLAICGWVLCTMGPFFLAFRAAGRLRIGPEEEAMGLDASKHGGSAYNMPGAGHIAGHGGAGGLWGNAMASGGGAAILVNSNNGQHAPLSYSNGVIGGGGGGGGHRSVGDGIMRGTTLGGTALGGGGGAAAEYHGAGAAGTGVVAPFDGLNSLMTAAAGGAGGYGHGPGGGGAFDLSSGSGHAERGRASSPSPLVGADGFGKGATEGTKEADGAQPAVDVMLYNISGGAAGVKMVPLFGRLTATAPPPPPPQQQQQQQQQAPSTAAAGAAQVYVSRGCDSSGRGGDVSVSMGGSDPASSVRQRSQPESAVGSSAPASAAVAVAAAAAPPPPGLYDGADAADGAVGTAAPVRGAVMAPFRVQAPSGDDSCRQ